MELQPSLKAFLIEAHPAWGVSILDHLVLEPPVEILRGFGIAHEVEPSPTP